MCSDSEENHDPGRVAFIEGNAVEKRSADEMTAGTEVKIVAEGSEKAFVQSYLSAER